MTTTQTSAMQALAVEALKEARKVAEDRQWVRDQRRQTGNFDLDMLAALHEQGWEVVRRDGR